MNDLTRQEKIHLMIEIRKSIVQIVSATFEAIDLDIQQNQIQESQEKMVNASKLRMDLKTLRKETIEKIRSIGAGYETEELHESRQPTNVTPIKR